MSWLLASIALDSYFNQKKMDEAKRVESRS